MKLLIRSFVILLLFSFFSCKTYSANNLFTKTESSNSISDKIIYQPFQYKIGFSSGWKAPYGTGVDLSILINELIDANIGCGISISGAKVGIGTRFYPLRENNFSPMLGAFLYHSKGQNLITVFINADSAKYRIKPDNAIQIDAGFRYRFGKGHYLIANLGYSIPFKGEDAEYISGSTLDSIQTFANGMTIGGISVYCGVLIKLSKGRYRIEH